MLLQRILSELCRCCGCGCGVLLVKSEVAADVVDVYLGAVCEAFEVAHISSVDIVVVKVRIEDWIDTYVDLIPAVAEAVGTVGSDYVAD